MIVACAADSRRDYSQDLERRVLAEGIEFLFEPIVPFTWKKMLEWELGVCRRFPKRTVIFVDAWDFLFVGNRGDLERATADQDVLFHSDAHCWPEPHKADLYPPSASRYRYVNGTGPAGKGEVIANLIEFGIREFPIRGNEASIFADNDQRFWTDTYLYNSRQYRMVKVDIDRACNLSIALNSIGDQKFDIVGKRLFLYPQGTMPAFIHCNGASDRRFAAELERLR